MGLFMGRRVAQWRNGVFRVISWTLTVDTVGGVGAAFELSFVDAQVLGRCSGAAAEKNRHDDPRYDEKESLCVHCFTSKVDCDYFVPIPLLTVYLTKGRCALAGPFFAGVLIDSALPHHLQQKPDLF
jgi:hypothetical protein